LRAQQRNLAPIDPQPAGLPRRSAPRNDGL
jgi:hypothetical protein